MKLVCREHPDAPVRHTWDEDTYFRGKKLRKPKIHNHVFTCAVCGKKLSREGEQNGQI